MDLIYAASSLQTEGKGLLDIVDEMTRVKHLLDKNRPTPTLPNYLREWDKKRKEQADLLDDAYKKVLELLPGKLDTWLNSNPPPSAVYEMKQKLLQLGGPETLTKPLEQYSIPQRINAGDFDEAVIQRLEKVLQHLKHPRRNQGWGAQRRV